MKKVKGFSYNTEKDMDAIRYIEKQPHQANYIIGLVRADMNKVDDIELLVKKYVEKILKEKNIKVDNKKVDNISKDDIINLLNVGK